MSTVVVGATRKQETGAAFGTGNGRTVSNRAHAVTGAGLGLDWNDGNVGNHDVAAVDASPVVGGTASSNDDDDDQEQEEECKSTANSKQCATAPISHDPTDSAAVVF